MYDKHGFILRIETTVNDVSFFKNHRQVEHRDGTTQTKSTSMKKGIYSLPALREVLCAANRRYLEFISASTPQPRGSTHFEKSLQPCGKVSTPTTVSISSQPKIRPSWKLWSVANSASAGFPTRPSQP